METAKPNYDKHLHCFESWTTIHGEQYEPGWYFSDEAYNYHGPHGTRDEALNSLKQYMKEIAGDRPRASGEDGTPGN